MSINTATGILSPFSIAGKFYYIYLSIQVRGKVREGKISPKSIEFVEFVLRGLCAEDH